jgi:hypothetical protein
MDGISLFFDAEMSNFFDEQGRTRVFVEAYFFVRRRRKTRGERRASEKGPFLD